ncbi:hypothetical protein ACFVXC_25730 [Streptomyces sp. NPDC058257]|uniref:hypothetical protein n=1 Tax=Streptomyces sp. NPDC058257 TaxID=3346409 RepID=UPI0036EEB35E
MTRNRHEWITVAAYENGTGTLAPLRPPGLHPSRRASRVTAPSPPKWRHAAAERRG